MEFFVSFIDLIKKIQLKYLKFKYRKYLQKSSSSNGLKNIIGKDYTVRFSSAFDTRKEEVVAKVENIVKKAKNNPYKLISYVEKHGTKIHKINNADKILAPINETEGFITPKKGFKALYLNALLNRKLSLQFKECFVMRNLTLDPYYTIHQFYTWYAYKSGFAGYEYEAQEKFNKIVNSKNKSESINELSIADILAVKEALNRDVEALDFVIKLAKNTDGAKSAFLKMLEKKSSVHV